ncbi:unnamed protein product [Lepidochelys olivacea]
MSPCGRTSPAMSPTAARSGPSQLPTVSSVPNGRQCLSFFKMGADGWQEKEKELLACTGTEDHCVEESGILTRG